MAGAHGAKVLHVYNAVFKGFNFALPGPAASVGRAVEAIRRNPNVMYIVPDEKLYAVTTQNTANWGLDRIDEYAGNLLDGTFDYFQTGSGVNIYIIDSGIAIHAEFQGRYGSMAFTSVYPNNAYQDCNGHGTMVASAAAGTRAGVAKGALVNSLQVLGCDGSGSKGDIAAAIDFVADYGQRPAVINLSLGAQTRWYSGVYAPEEDAVRGAIARGVHVVIAAGNDGINACDYTPARVAEAITVGATNQTDERVVIPGWWSSNYGSCVDLFAPGLHVEVARTDGTMDSDAGSGTSIAAPYVTGTVALILSYTPFRPPWEIQRIVTESAAGINTSTLGPGSPGRRLYSPHTRVVLSGTQSICSYQSGNYTWRVQVVGGDATREYDWYIDVRDGEDEIYPGPTNAPEFTQYIDTSIEYFTVVAQVFTYGTWYRRELPVTIVEC